VISKKRENCLKRCTPTKELRHSWSECWIDKYFP